MISTQTAPSRCEATASLRDDHEAILSLVDLIEQTAALLEEGRAMEGRELDAVQELLVYFVDRCHPHQEETVLFPALEAKGMPRDGGPIGVMLAEHETGRGLVGHMEKATLAYAAGSTTAAGDYAAAASRYAGLLRQHILKENDILFAMADACTTEEEQRVLAAGYDRIDAEQSGPGLRQRIHAHRTRIRSILAAE